MQIAKAIVTGIGKNISYVLYHYYKHDKKEVKPAIDWLKKELPEKIERAETIPELMAYEGEAWDSILWVRFSIFFQKIL